MQYFHSGRGPSRGNFLDPIGRNVLVGSIFLDSLESIPFLSKTTSWISSSRFQSTRITFFQNFQKQKIAFYCSPGKLDWVKKPNVAHTDGFFAVPTVFFSKNTHLIFLSRPLCLFLYTETYCIKSFGKTLP